MTKNQLVALSPDLLRHAEGLTTDLNAAAFLVHQALMTAFARARRGEHASRNGVIADIETNAARKRMAPVRTAC